MTFESKKSHIVLIVFTLVLGIFGFALNAWGPVPEIEAVPDVESSWEKFVSHDKKVSFRYPKEFSGTYFHLENWPPAISVNPEFFSCTEKGADGIRAVVSEKIINGSMYCVRKDIEGAAGSTYVTYAHTGEREESVVVLTTTVRFPQCANYGELARAACTQEQELFDLDYLAHQIMGTVQIKSSRTRYE